MAVNLIEGNLHEVIAFLENRPNGPAILPEMDEKLIEWRRRCLSIVSEIDIERDGAAHMVDTMTIDLRKEIEAMIAENHRQRAVARLRETARYAKQLKVLRGTVARQMVRIIEKRMKQTAGSAPLTIRPRID